MFSSTSSSSFFRNLLLRSLLSETRPDKLYAIHTTTSISTSSLTSLPCTTFHYWWIYRCFKLIPSRYSSKFGWLGSEVVGNTFIHLLCSLTTVCSKKHKFILMFGFSKMVKKSKLEQKDGQRVISNYMFEVLFDLKSGIRTFMDRWKPTCLNMIHWTRKMFSILRIEKFRFI